MDDTRFAPCRLYLGTEDGLRTARLTADGVKPTAVGFKETARTLSGEAVRAISVHPEDPDDAYVGCGLRGRGLYHTGDAGTTVESLGFEDEWVWGVARHPNDPGTLFVGTEPPMLYVSRDGGETFDAFEDIDDLPSRSEWTFFHEPFYAGHVHGIAIHPDRPERVLAGVEQGAILSSSDAGETWSESLVGADVHRVAFHPDDPDRAFAATGSGLYRSRDAGDEWTRISDLRGKYVHAIVFHPDEPDRTYVYVAEEDSPIYRSKDGGDSWDAIAEGLPDARPADSLRLHPTDPETLIYAGDAGDAGEGASHLFVSTDAGETWQRSDQSLPKVWRVEVALVPER